MRRCSNCYLEKDLNEFFFQSKENKKLHAQCKLCYKEYRKKIYAKHYAKYGNEYRRRARERRRKLKKEYQDNILDYLRDKYCVICGESDVRTLELDHLNPKDKLFTVSQAVRLGYSWQDVLNEIKKCRLLCSNCHKKETSSQYNWYKSQ